MSSTSKDAEDRPQSKRSRESSPQPTRKKRGRYTLNACDECKRRKTKCSGETPCQLCKSIGETCQYSRETGEEVTQKYMNGAIQSLQRQIGELSSIVKSLRNEGISPASDRTITADAPSYSPRTVQMTAARPAPTVSTMLEPPRHSGPTASSYAFNVLDSTLKESGIPEYADSGEPSAPASPPVTEADAPERYQDYAAVDDPLTVMTPNDLLRFLNLYEEDIGMQIPHLEVEKINTCIRTHAKRAPAGPIERHIDCTGTSGKCYLVPGSDSLLRALLALMLQIEDHRNGAIAQKLMDSLENSENRRFARDSDIQPDDMSIVVLKSLFYFLADNERLAWRLMGFAARMCLEIGLHRRQSATRFASPEEHTRAVKLFWCVYVLDRRWSFGTGLPAAINDADIDQQLNDTDTASCYLRSMISYCKIAAGVWRATSNLKSNSDVPSTHDCSYMEFQVTEWRNAHPNSLQLASPYEGFDPKRHNRGVYRLQQLLYLRANQMLILIHRPFLFSKASINLHRDKAGKAVEWAKDTIKVLKRLHETSDIYSRQHMVFNHFLDSALAILLLAVYNEPKGMADLVRRELTVALALVQSLSTRSPMSKKLWNRLKRYRNGPRNKTGTGTKELAPKLQKQETPSQQDQLDQSIAAAMPNTNDVVLNSFPTPTFSDTSNPWDPETQMSLDSLFNPNNAYILDQMQGNPRNTLGEFYSEMVRAPQNSITMSSPNMPGTWALNDPNVYANGFRPVSTAITYPSQPETWAAPINLDEMGRDHFLSF